MSLQEERETLLSGRWKPLASRIHVHDWIIPAVMLVQLSLFLFAWTFAGLMMRKTIPLPDSKAEWIQSNPSDTQFIITLISTVFALISSSLLGKAVQFALVRRLTSGSLRLCTMVEWAKLSQRSISLGGRFPWVLLSVAWVGLLGFLTTAWSSLLAPQSVTIYNDFQDYDLNFLNPSLSKIFFGALSPPYTLDAGDLFDYLEAFAGINFVTAVLNAGIARMVITNLAHPPTQPGTSFISIPYSLYVGNTTTGGIGISPSGKLGPSPPSVGITAPGNAWYQGLSRTYNVTQQGFTAGVSCRTPTSNDPTITSNITESFKSVSDPNHSIYMYNWSTNCSSDAQYSTAGVTKTGVNPANGLLMASICFSQGFTGPSNQSFLVLLGTPLGSSYPATFNLTCQVTPLVTTVQTTYYEQSNIVNITQPPLSQHTLPDPTSIISTVLTAWYPAAVIWSIFVQSQGINGNLIGDQISAAAMGSVSEANIELYLTGMIECIGTILKSQVDLRGPAVQTEMDALSQVNGTVVVQTYGWTFHLRTHGPSLAAITLVTVLTVAAWVYTILKVDPPNKASETRNPRAPLVHTFNPTDTMVVLLASSAGDLSTVLSESGNVYQRGGASENRGGRSAQDVAVQVVDDRLRVVLRTTESGSPALRIVGVDDTGLNGANEVSFRSGLFRYRAGMQNKDNGSSVDEIIELGGTRTRTRTDE